MRPSRRRPAFFLFVPPHCLKKNGDARPRALVAHVGRPTAGPSAARPGPDSPPTITQSMPRRSSFAQGAEQRLEREELHARARRPRSRRCGRRTSAFSTLTPIQTFGGHSSLGLSSASRSRALREHLEAVPVRAPHHVEHALDVRERHILVEQVAHRVHEDRLRLLPLERQLQHLRLQRELEAVPVVRLPHRLQPLRHALGVAVLAARADLVAARDRVPRRLGPLDAGAVRHQRTSFEKVVRDAQRDGRALLVAGREAEEVERAVRRVPQHARARRRRRRKTSRRRSLK